MNKNRDIKEDRLIESVCVLIENHSAVVKLIEFSPNLAPLNILMSYYDNLVIGKGKIFNHIYNLLERAEKINVTRGLTKSDYVELLIAIIYHDFVKIVDEKFLSEGNPILSKVLRLDLGHSNSVRRLFFYIDEPRIAHGIRHNSTDFVIDIALRSVTVPQLALNLLDKTDDSGSFVPVWVKYEIIKNKIGNHPDYDDDSEIISCKYLDRVSKEKSNFYDYEFITKEEVPSMSSLIVQRFDGKYCAPIGKYSDTSSNLKISKYVSFWGYNTNILHEGDFRQVTDNRKTTLLGCDSEGVDRMLPIFCDKNDTIVIEGSTSRLSAVREIISPTTGLVLLLRTLADGSFGKQRLINSSNADEIWVMTEDMKKIIENGSKLHNIELPEIRILQSGFDSQYFFIDEKIKRKKGKITYVGAVTDIKGVDILVHAFKEISEDFPFAELHIIGDPNIYGRVNVFDLDLLKHSKIIYHGACNSSVIARHLKEAHFSVLLTRIYETFGKAALQARCCGTRMIVSDQGALPFHVQSKQEGIVLKEISTEKVKESLIKLLKEEPATVTPDFDRYHEWKITALDYAIYTSLLKRKVFKKTLLKIREKEQNISK